MVTTSRPSWKTAPSLDYDIHIKKNIVTLPVNKYDSLSLTMNIGIASLNPLKNGSYYILLSFNRTQTRAVIGLLTGHNTLRIHLHVMGLSDNPTCRKCGAEEESSAHILCECKALASLRHIHLGSFFLDPVDIRVLGAGAIWNFVKGTGLL